MDAFSLLGALRNIGVEVAFAAGNVGLAGLLGATGTVGSDPGGISIGSYAVVSGVAGPAGKALPVVVAFAGTGRSEVSGEAIVAACPTRPLQPAEPPDGEGDKLPAGAVSLVGAERSPGRYGFRPLPAAPRSARATYPADRVADREDSPVTGRESLRDRVGAGGSGGVRSSGLSSSLSTARACRSEPSSCSACCR